MAGRILPVTFVWVEADVVNDDGSVDRRMVMAPLKRFDNVCARQFVDLEEYTLAPLETRSRASHNGYFAALNDGFDNLPETLEARFPSPEHLRKWLLVRTGFFEEKEFDFDDEKDARRLGAFIRADDDYAVISIHKGAGDKRVKVIVRRAKSQNAKSMGKDEFEKSKKAVLDELEHMIGVERGKLRKNAGRSA